MCKEDLKLVILHKLNVYLFELSEKQLMLQHKADVLLEYTPNVIQMSLKLHGVNKKDHRNLFQYLCISLVPM